jgi:hypothetical protein
MKISDAERDLAALKYFELGGSTADKDIIKHYGPPRLYFPYDDSRIIYLRTYHESLLALRQFRRVTYLCAAIIGVTVFNVVYNLFFR